MSRLRRDDGFTLSELIVVIGLMGMILAVAWLALSLTSHGSRTADRASMSAREVAYPLLQCERLLIQQHNILTGTVEGRNVNPTAYLVAFNTDQDHDSHIESTIIEATAGGDLVISTSETSEHGLESVTWSTNNTNRATNTPLFTYFDEDGAELAYNSITTNARSVEITIATEWDGEPYSDSRMVSFRNR